MDGLKQQDPNNGYTVVWVLGLETHPVRATVPETVRLAGIQR